jgi:p-aminobenzoyl-glutamate transporter AbgT
MQQRENLLLRADRKSVSMSSCTIFIYGVFQILIALFLLQGSIFLHCFGSLYCLTGLLGFFAAKYSSLMLSRFYLCVLIFLIVCNAAMIIFLTILLILFLVDTGTCRNSSDCNLSNDSYLAILIVLLIALAFSIGSLIYLLVLRKISKNFYCDLRFSLIRFGPLIDSN